MYCTLLPQCVLRHASLQGEIGGKDAQGNPCSGEQKSRQTREKAKATAEKIRSMKLEEVAKKAEDGIEATPTYCDLLYDTGSAW